MDRQTMKWICCAVAGLLLCFQGVPAAVAEEAPDPDGALIKMMRFVLQSDVKAVITANLELTPKESEDFWPLYDKYLEARTQVDNRMSTLIMDYARSYNTGTVSDEEARDLLKQWLRVEKDSFKLKKKYTKKFRRVLPATKVLRCFQLENKIDAIVQLGLAKEIPLAR